MLNVLMALTIRAGWLFIPLFIVVGMMGEELLAEATAVEVDVDFGCRD